MLPWSQLRDQMRRTTVTEQFSEQTAADDTEGHALKGRGADAETAEGQQDTEGHMVRPGRGAEAEEAEGDVEGHSIKPGRG